MLWNGGECTIVHLKATSTTVTKQGGVETVSFHLPGASYGGEQWYFYPFGGIANHWGSFLRPIANLLFSNDVSCGSLV